MDLKNGSKGLVNVTFDSYNEQALVGPYIWPHMTLGGRLKYAAGMILNRSMEYAVPLHDAWAIQDQLEVRCATLKDKLANRGGPAADAWVVIDATSSLKEFLGTHHRSIK